MIDSTEKDTVLIELCSYEETELEFELTPLALKLGLSIDKLERILEHFERLGLCYIDRYIGGVLYVVVNVEAYDIARFGGFTGQEEIFKKNLEKLDFELNKLDSQTLEKLSTLVGIVGNLSSFLTLLR